jgi:ubiquinone/menaquinone biosynthesis C-methylase UbiE
MESPPSTIELDDDIVSRIPKKSKVLEVACALGRTAFRLEGLGHSVTAIDIDPDTVERAREIGNANNSGVEFLEADGRRLPFDNFSFDLVIMNGYMTMLTDMESRILSIIEAFRVLKEGGALYLADFLVTEDNKAYLKRYEEHSKITGEEHTFIVHDNENRELYRCHHYRESELKALLDSRFHIVETVNQEFKSYHGNRVNGIIILAFKK